MSIISGIDWFFFDVQSILHFIEPEQPIDEYTVIIEIQNDFFTRSIKQTETLLVEY